MTEYWQYFTTFMQQHFGLSPHRVAQLLATLSVFLLYFLVTRILDKTTFRKVQDVNRQYLIKKTYRILFLVIVLLSLARIWLSDKTGLAAYIGIVSAGLAIALQEPLGNLAGGLFIAVRKPFTVGDRIEINQIRGDVIDTRMFQFSVVEIGHWVQADQSTGRIIHLPNNWVFKHAQANFTEGFNYIWNEIPITVTFESDWVKAKTLLTEIANHLGTLPAEQIQGEMRRAAKKYLVYFRNTTPIVWTRIADVGVTLTIRYLCEPRKRRSSETTLSEAILEAFAREESIDFAYPTMRYYDNVTEGKPGARAAPPAPPPPPAG